MTSITFIGDPHGKVDDYQRITKATNFSLAVGDMGIGFKDILYSDLSENHVFICGNHDNRLLAEQHPNYLGNFGSWKGVFFLSGAASVDTQKRVIGVDWWDWEALL